MRVIIKRSDLNRLKEEKRQLRIKGDRDGRLSEEMGRIFYDYPNELTWRVPSIEELDEFIKTLEGWIKSFGHKIEEDIP